LLVTIQEYISAAKDFNGVINNGMKMAEAVEQALLITRKFYE